MAPAPLCQTSAGERTPISRRRKSLAVMAIVGGLLLVIRGPALADCDPERAPTICNSVPQSSRPAASPASGARKAHDQVGRRDRDKSTRAASRLPLSSAAPVVSAPPSISVVREAERNGIEGDNARSASSALLGLWLGITVVLFLLFEGLHRYAPIRSFRNASLYLRWGLFRWQQWRFASGRGAVSWFTSPFRGPAGESPA